ARSASSRGLRRLKRSTDWCATKSRCSPRSRGRRTSARTEAPVNWRIAVDGEETTAILDQADKGDVVFVAAHGAGSHMDHRSMLQLSQVLRSRDIDVVRFNFLYREKGARAPDRMPKLQACFSAVVQHARTNVPGKKLIIGGRSMGGRVAS